jgi:hypothetical protein
MVVMVPLVFRYYPNQSWLLYCYEEDTDGIDIDTMNYPIVDIHDHIDVLYIHDIFAIACLYNWLHAHKDHISVLSNVIHDIHYCQSNELIGKRGETERQTEQSSPRSDSDMRRTKDTTQQTHSHY